jgi:phosphoribosylformylglycinamidine cyclo-ligase
LESILSTSEGKRDLYKEAGVDVAKGDHLVDWLHANNLQKVDLKLGSVVSGIGGFAGLFRPNFKGMEDPLLIASTDGVGTKVLLAIESNILGGIGQDLVAMCVNDLYTIGGRPLFFLDYYATGALDENQFKEVLTGIKNGCRQSNAVLLGGETAEMPGLYEKGHFDLAGFVIGMVDGKKMLKPELVEVGDILFALPSTGFHSNGYSLVRKWLKEKPADKKLLNQIMQPTKIYHEIPELLDTLGTGVLHAAANITGGGISGNLPRVMPNDVDCEISFKAIKTQDWMQGFIESQGSDAKSQEGVFNIGCGMILAVSKSGADKFLAAARKLDLEPYEIGKVVVGKNEPSVIFK